MQITVVVNVTEKLITHPHIATSLLHQFLHLLYSSHQFASKHPLILSRRQHSYPRCCWLLQSWFLWSSAFTWFTNGRIRPNLDLEDTATANCQVLTTTFENESPSSQRLWFRGVGSRNISDIPFKSYICAQLSTLNSTILFKFMVSGASNLP